MGFGAICARVISPHGIFHSFYPRAAGHGIRCFICGWRPVLACLVCGVCLSALVGNRPKATSSVDVATNPSHAQRHAVRAGCKLVQLVAQQRWSMA